MFFGAILLLSASKAFSTQTAYGTITLIKAFESQAYIYVDGLNDPFGCDNTTLVRFYWTVENVDRLWSLLLAAQMSGKKVSFEGECVAGALAATGIYLES